MRDNQSEMKLQNSAQQFRREDRAVSPVIGVILMVAITVILAAVIGVFVMGLGDEIGDTAPTATVDFDGGTEEVAVNHANGDTLQLDDEFTLLVDGTGVDEPAWTASEISAGETSTANVDEIADVAALGSGDPGTFEVQLRHDPSGTIVDSGTVEIEGAA